jgi:hypothetical protein
MMNLVRLENGFLGVSQEPTVSTYESVGEKEEDRTPYGDVPLIQCLGVASMPFPEDGDGYAEGVVLDDIGGYPGIVVAAWDRRTFSIFGNLEAGDTVLHSTGPAKAAQCLLKETKKQAVLMTRDKNDAIMCVMVDGKNGKLQLQAFGHVFEIVEDGINIEVGDCGIRLSKDGIHMRGASVSGGMAPIPQMSMAVAPIATWAALSALAGPITPIPNAMGAP